MISTKSLDKRWDAREKGGWPLCPAPLPAEVGQKFVCPNCNTKWKTIEQDGKIVWTNKGRI